MAIELIQYDELNIRNLFIIMLYIIVISQDEYDILVITGVLGKAEDDY